MKVHYGVLTTCIVFAAAAGTATAAEHYVDIENLGGTENGNGWDTAYGTIQPAVDEAASGDTIYVADGIYNEYRYEAPPSLRANGALFIKAGITLIGGYAGKDNPTGSQSWRTNVTIIDGLVARNGSAAYHVIDATDTVGGTAETTIDGFTVRNGSSNGSGGGLYIYQENYPIVVQNCTFTTNTASGYGAGIYNASSTLTCTTCMFINNTCSGASSRSGAGIYTSSGTLSATNCVFDSNHAGSSSSGGGLEFNTGTFTAMNCTFANNSAIVGAAASVLGGGTHSITNSILWGNDATTVNDDSDTGQLNGSPTLTYSCIQYADEPGADNINPDSHPYLAATTSTPYTYTDLHLRADSPCINVGTNSGAPGTDYDNVDRPRPNSGTVDMGAYEYVVPVTVVTPNGYPDSPGEDAGNYSVTWNTDASHAGNAFVGLYRCDDGGWPHVTITSSTPFNGESGTNHTYTWLWSDISTRAHRTDYRMRVYWTSDNLWSTDYSDDRFTVGTPSVAITFPAGGETLGKGMSYNITWDNTGTDEGTIQGGVFGGVRIYDYLNWTKQTPDLGTEYAQAGSWTWIIGDGIAEVNNHRVRIESIENNDIDSYCGSVFTVAAQPTLTVVSPNGAEVWKRGESHNITWTQGGVLGRVRINLYDNWTPLQELGQTTSMSATSWQWDIPSDFPLLTTYRIRVTSLHLASIVDYGNGLFTIAVP